MPKIHRCGELGCYEIVPINYRYCKKHYLKHHAEYENSKESRRANRAYEYHRQRQTKHYDTKVRAKTETKDGNVSRSKFYRSKMWQSVRDNVVIKYGNECQVCGAIKPRMYVDHVIPLRICSPKERVATSNLWVLCGRCHQTKTKIESQLTDKELIAKGTKTFYKKEISRQSSRKAY